MKELSSPSQTAETSGSIPDLPLSQKSGGYSISNRKSGVCSIQKVYPWLLFASTAVAATFCLAYISKPVIHASPSPLVFTKNKESLSEKKPSVQPLTEEIAPNLDSLPGDQISSAEKDSTDSTPASPSISDFEETNIRIQHALDISSPGGEVNRIVIDVPVLYQSRNLRWSQQETAQARVLLDRLTLYQENVRALRDEAKILRNEWNSLIGSSIPSQVLRVDSPSLPINQKDQLSPKTSADSVNSIKLSKPNE